MCKFGIIDYLQCQPNVPSQNTKNEIKQMRCQLYKGEGVTTATCGSTRPPVGSVRLAWYRHVSDQWHPQGQLEMRAIQNKGHRATASRPIQCRSLPPKRHDGHRPPEQRPLTAPEGGGAQAPSTRTAAAAQRDAARDNVGIL